MNRRQQRKTALITGASRGIGAAIATRFAKAGYDVVIHYHQAKAAAEQVAHRCSEYDVRVLTEAADIASSKQVDELHARLQEQGMLPDILINNAGFAHYGMLMDMTEHEWDKVMDINLKGVFLCTRIFMKHMLGQRFGRIINISSVWGSVGGSCEVAYSAAKGGVNAFTKALAKELAPSGITVNAVAPGVVDTDMMQLFDAEDRRMLLEEIPLGRFARPVEIASLVYYLTLPEADYITGQIISVNGGWQT